MKRCHCEGKEKTILWGSFLQPIDRGIHKCRFHLPVFNITSKIVIGEGKKIRIQLTIEVQFCYNIKSEAHLLTGGFKTFGEK